MKPDICDHIREALLLTQTSNRTPQQTPALAQHLACCAECRAFRRHVFAMLRPNAPEPEVGHEACQADLAAYVDLSLDAGARDAAAAYPHVWWHLWDCAACATVFVQTTALARAERTGALPPLPIAKPPVRRRVIGRLAVTPQAVARVVQMRVQFGAAYGSGDDVLLDESEDEGHSFQLSLRRAPNGMWAVLVSVVPPVSGVAVVRIGGTSFQAPFDLNGVATIGDVPAELLRDGQPAILVAIEAEP